MCMHAVCVHVLVLHAVSDQMIAWSVGDWRGWTEGVNGGQRLRCVICLCRTWSGRLRVLPLATMTVPLQMSPSVIVEAYRCRNLSLPQGNVLSRNVVFDFTRNL